MAGMVGEFGGEGMREDCEAVDVGDGGWERQGCPKRGSRSRGVASFERT